MRVHSEAELNIKHTDTPIGMVGVFVASKLTANIVSWCIEHLEQINTIRLNALLHVFILWLIISGAD